MIPMNKDKVRKLAKKGKGLYEKYQPMHPRAMGVKDTICSLCVLASTAARAKMPLAALPAPGAVSAEAEGSGLLDRAAAALMPWEAVLRPVWGRGHLADGARCICH